MAIITKSCKNAISLARSNKKNTRTSLVVYIPQNSLEIQSSCISSPVRHTDIDNEHHSTNQAVQNKNDSKPISSQLVFSYSNKTGLIVRVDFVRLNDIFAKILSRSSFAIGLNSLVNERCAYCFDSTTKYYINISDTRRELCNRLSILVRRAKMKALARHTTTIKVLTECENFVFYL